MPAHYMISLQQITEENNILLSQRVQIPPVCQNAACSDTELDTAASLLSTGSSLGSAPAAFYYFSALETL